MDVTSTKFYSSPITFDGTEVGMLDGQLATRGEMCVNMVLNVANLYDDSIKKQLTDFADYIANIAETANTTTTAETTNGN